MNFICVTSYFSPFPPKSTLKTAQNPPNSNKKQPKTRPKIKVMPTALVTVELISYHLCLAHRVGIIILTLCFGKAEWEQFDSELILIEFHSVCQTIKLRYLSQLYVPGIYVIRKPNRGQKIEVT